jgi:hypothetical protein
MKVSTKEQQAIGLASVTNGNYFRLIDCCVIDRNSEDCYLCLSSGITFDMSKQMCKCIIIVPLQLNF